MLVGRLIPRDQAAPPEGSGHDHQPNRDRSDNFGEPLVVPKIAITIAPQVWPRQQWFSTIEPMREFRTSWNLNAFMGDQSLSRWMLPQQAIGGTQFRPQPP
jgi:hypothetical protein